MMCEESGACLRSPPPSGFTDMMTERSNRGAGGRRGGGLPFTKSLRFCWRQKVGGGGGRHYRQRHSDSQQSCRLILCDGRRKRNPALLSFFPFFPVFQKGVLRVSGAADGHTRPSLPLLPPPDCVSEEMMRLAGSSR